MLLRELKNRGKIFLMTAKKFEVFARCRSEAPAFYALDTQDAAGSRCFLNESATITRT